jgi:predicted methyltransferase
MKRFILVAALLLTASNIYADGHSAIEQAVANSARPEADTLRDSNRKPAEVLEFFGIEPGMNVLDIFAGGGYYTEILSYLVGDDGKVTLYNNGGWNGFVNTGVTERLANDRLANVESLVAEADEIDFAANSYDAALFVLGFHDLYYVDTIWPAIEPLPFITAIYNSIKPDGLLGIVDHIAEPGGSSIEVANSLHRIDPAIIQRDMLAAGFVLEAESTLLRNTSDNHMLPMRDPSVQGKTDRIIYLFRKPMS